ncbi:hypothetical protein CIB84_011900, partial [Bambusicola thoracicus]
MYNSAYILDDHPDDEIPTQQAIQESLQDIHKMERSANAIEDESFLCVGSKEREEIIAAIRTVKYKSTTLHRS